ncbi:hypothetical protein Tco_1134167, partial [Tanacetum coccineum]
MVAVFAPLSFVVEGHYGCGGYRRGSLEEVFKLQSEHGAMVSILDVSKDDAEDTEMVALSCCVYDGGLIERGNRFAATAFIFLASGRIYDSERHMDPLLEMFPVLQT